MESRGQTPEIRDREGLPNNRRKVFFGLFVFPMLIAVTMALLLSGIVLLTHEEETPETLITAIKTGPPSKRWQKAFELSNELNREGGMLRSAGIMNEVVHILNDEEHYDAKTRAYMAMALGRFQDPEAEMALRKALQAVHDSEDPQLPLFLMWAIAQKRGQVHQAESVPVPLEEGAAQEVVRFLGSRHDDLRKTAAYVLGVIYSRDKIVGASFMTPDDSAGAINRAPTIVINGLKHALEDPVIDVRWNAALSLARLGDDSGREVLLEMLDRSQLKTTHHMNEVEIEQVMANAAKGLGLIKDQETQSILEGLAKTDPSLKVRQAAMNAMRNSERGVRND
ncbi:MAG: HEAT repeat domain-containing protein [Candidatus Omnitrophica bacterium]|nr:HEAT repeat domain-containing protein [Candidatus Omnitrophota bacterium]